MKINNTVYVASPLSETWAFVVKPANLGTCLPGCQDLREVDGDTYEAKVTTKIAYLSMTFQVTVKILGRNEPSQMRTAIEGKPATLAGHLKGTQVLSLREVPGGTAIDYEMDLHLGGRLGSMGEPVFRSKGQEMGREFGAAIQERLGVLVPEEGQAHG